MSTKMKRTSKAKTCRSCPVEGLTRQHIPAENGNVTKKYDNHRSQSASTSTSRQKYVLVKEKPLELQYGLDYEECIPVTYNLPQPNQQIQTIPRIHQGDLVCQISFRSFRICFLLMASIATAVCVLLAYLESHQSSYPELSYVKSKPDTCRKSDINFNSKQYTKKFQYDEHKSLEDVDLQKLLTRIEDLIESNIRLQMEAASFKQQHSVLKEAMMQMKSSVDSLKEEEGTLSKTSKEVKFQEKNIEKLFREISSYDADKLGLPDFALESSGGQIVSTPDTKTVSLNTWFTLWGFPLWNIGKSARNVIQASVLPGDCWAFHGSSGKVVIELAMPVFIGAVTIEHIPISIALTGKIDSAPRVFTVIGLREPHDVTGVGLGHYTYSATGTPRQSFAITKQDAESTIPFKAVILWILSNHGHPEYTCVYRFRVHGHVHTMEESKANF